MSDSRPRADALVGNGVGLVREIALAARVQKALETLYRLDRAADVDDFMVHAEGERETLLVRESADGLELRLRVPKLDSARGDQAQLDPICQIIEGVSHFVYLADRATRGREATQLELEVQAEVDKYVVLAASIESFDKRASQRLRERLYDSVTYMHAPDTEEGERYRVANTTAKRFTAMLEREFVARARFGELHKSLRAFFEMGQTAKLRAA